MIDTETGFILDEHFIDNRGVDSRTQDGNFIVAGRGLEGLKELVEKLDWLAENNIEYIFGYKWHLIPNHEHKVYSLSPALLFFNKEDKVHFKLRWE